MTSKQENSSNSPNMGHIEDSKSDIKHFVSNSQPQTVIPSNSSSPPPPPQLSPSSTTSTPVSLQRSSNDYEDDEDYFNTFPPGYRFCPRDDELVMHYLLKKVKGQQLARNRIFDVILYQNDPDYLAATHKTYGEKEWYFFTPRDKKYKNGSRPNRSTGVGYWKATGADRRILNKDNTLLGYRKALVYYNGKAPKGDKTNWIMHEYRVDEGKSTPNQELDDMRLDDWVLCRLYKKNTKPGKQENSHSQEYDNPDNPDEYLMNNDDDNYNGEILNVNNPYSSIVAAAPALTGLHADAVDYFNFYNPPMQDVQVPTLAETLGNDSRWFSLDSDNWSSKLRGYQEVEYLNHPNLSYCDSSSATQFFNCHPAMPISRSINHLPANFTPVNYTAPQTLRLPPAPLRHILSPAKHASDPAATTVEPKISRQSY